MHKTFLGVTSNKTILKHKIGTKSFWCVYPSYEASIDDLLVMHKTVYGIAQIYKIISEPYHNGQPPCNLRGMPTVNIVLLANLEQPIRVVKNLLNYNLKVVSYKPATGAILLV